MEALQNPTEHVKKLLEYIYPQSKDITRVIFNKERISMKIMAKISVYCIITRSKNSSHFENLNEVKSDDHLKTIENLILLKNTEVLLMDKMQKPKKTGENVKTNYIIKESALEMLCMCLNLDHQISADQDNTFKDLNIVLSNVELYLQILNELLKNNAFNEENFKKFIILKKLMFKIQEMDLCFIKLLEVNLSTVETNEILVKLRSIFSEDYHDYINNIFKLTNFTSMIQWLFRKIGHEASNDSRQIEVIQFGSMSTEQQNRFVAMAILAHYMKFDGVNTDLVREFFNPERFNSMNNNDLFAMFELSKILLKQTPTHFIADWIAKNIKEICGNHYKNNGMCESIMDIYADLIEFAKDYQDQDQDLFIVVRSFMRLATTKAISLELTVKLLSLMKHFVKVM